MQVDIRTTVLDKVEIVTEHYEIEEMDGGEFRVAVRRESPARYATTLVSGLKLYQAVDCVRALEQAWVKAFAEAAAKGVEVNPALLAEFQGVESD